MGKLDYQLDRAFLWYIRVAMVCLVAATLLLCASAVRLAFAHGDAEWIMRDPRHKDIHGVHCCGPSDCKKIDRSEVTATPEGYRVHGALFAYDSPALYQSIDADYWLCERDVPKCLFTPEGSS